MLDWHFESTPSRCFNGPDRAQGVPALMTPYGVVVNAVSIPNVSMDLRDKATSHAHAMVLYNKPWKTESRSSQAGSCGSKFGAAFTSAVVSEIPYNNISTRLVIEKFASGCAQIGLLAAGVGNSRVDGLGGAAR